MPCHHVAVAPSFPSFGFFERKTTVLKNVFLVFPALIPASEHKRTQKKHTFRINGSLHSRFTQRAATHTSQTSPHIFHTHLGPAAPGKSDKKIPPPTSRPSHPLGGTAEDHDPPFSCCECRVRSHDAGQPGRRPRYGAGPS